jgi:tetratricopeptide (TPR) repeat protein
MTFINLFKRALVLVPLFALITAAPLLAEKKNIDLRYELMLDAKIFSKLDTFESVSLEEADRAFSEHDFVGAAAAYKAFTFEFGQSKALCYALFRMARCMHLVDKRNAAIKAYQNVVDYFPDNVVFAAEAMYQQGICHRENGDDNKCVAVWAKMVKDRDYVNQAKSGTALEFLAKLMDKRKKYKDATEYRWRTAKNFRKKNPHAAHNAGVGVVDYYVWLKDLENLSKFCVDASGVGFTRVGYGNRIDQLKGFEKPETCRGFWSRALDHAQKLNRGADNDERLRARKEVTKYWVGQSETRFKDEDWKIHIANCKLIYEEDGRKKWHDRIDGLFSASPVTLERVKKYMGVYNYNKSVRLSFFKKNAQPIINSMKDFKEKIDFAKFLRSKRMEEEASTIANAITPGGLKDDELVSLLSFFSVGTDRYNLIWSKIKDKFLAAKTRLDQWWRHRKWEEALVDIQVLKKSPKYAQQVVWMEAECLQFTQQFEKAIKAFRAANRQPDSTWRVADCQIAMEQFDDAVRTVTGLQMVGGAVASRAAYKIADIYKLMGKKGKEIDQLRLVLRRHPGTREASGAHQRLERYGVKLIGGESKAKE